MVGHGGSSAGSYLADPTSPIPSHCASIVATSTVRVKIRAQFTQHTHTYTRRSGWHLSDFALFQILRLHSTHHASREDTKVDDRLKGCDADSVYCRLSCLQNIFMDLPVYTPLLLYANSQMQHFGSNMTYRNEWKDLWSKARANWGCSFESNNWHKFCIIISTC